MKSRFNYRGLRHARFDELLGLTITEVTGLGNDSDRVTLFTSDGRKWQIYHDQD